MNKEYRYLVANPSGFILVKCQSTDEADKFIDWHYNRCEKSYKILYNRKVCKAEYGVIDLNEIPTLMETL